MASPSLRTIYIEETYTNIQLWRLHLKLSYQMLKSQELLLSNREAQRQT